VVFAIGPSRHRKGRLGVFVGAPSHALCISSLKKCEKKPSTTRHQGPARSSHSTERPTLPSLYRKGRGMEAYPYRSSNISLPPAGQRADSHAESRKRTRWKTLRPSYRHGKTTVAASRSTTTQTVKGQQGCPMHRWSSPCSPQEVCTPLC